MYCIVLMHFHVGFMWSTMTPTHNIHILLLLWFFPFLSGMKYQQECHFGPVRNTATEASLTFARLNTGTKHQPLLWQEGLEEQRLECGRLAVRSWVVLWHTSEKHIYRFRIGVLNSPTAFHFYSHQKNQVHKQKQVVMWAYKWRDSYESSVSSTVSRLLLCAQFSCKDVSQKRQRATLKAEIYTIVWKNGSVEMLLCKRGEISCKWDFDGCDSPAEFQQTSRRSNNHDD